MSISTAPAPGSNAVTVALVGNPNCGKTALFNALTGSKQKVANYPGVTVEKKVGEAYSQHGKPMRVIDLPGAYSLAARSPDEAVTRDVLLGREPHDWDLTTYARPDPMLEVFPGALYENRFACQELWRLCEAGDYPYTAKV